MEPTLSLVEAAARTGKSRATLQRMISGGQIAGATKRGRAWRLPISGLEAAGLPVSDAPVVSSPAELVAITRDRDNARSDADRYRVMVEMLTGQVDDLHQANRDLRANVDDLRAALEDQRRALTMGQPSRPEPVGPVEPVRAETPVVRRSRWRVFRR